MFQKQGNLFQYRFIYIVILLVAGCAGDHTFVNSKVMSWYPSGSGLSFYDNKIYLAGDDVNYVLVLDSAFNVLDSILLFDSAQKRSDKKTKADVESASLISIDKEKNIFFAGSGSLSPYRNSGWMMDPVSKEKIQVDLGTFYSRLKKEGIEALNIEGIASMPGGIVFASRGNKTIRSNYLVFAAHNFWKKQDITEIKICKVGTNPDTSAFQGVSGLEYSEFSDQLLLTVSTENTHNAYEDGTIGKSFLWIIHNISAKRNLLAVNPTRVIDLESLDKRFTGHKIESVCILSENKKQMTLVLVADDDNGTSVLFKIVLKK